MSAATPLADPTPAPAADPTPDPTPEPAPQPKLTSWTESLDADLRQEASLGRYKTLNDFAKAHLELRKGMSQKGVIMPAADAKPEAWEQFYSETGRPAKPEEYDLGDFKAPDGVPWDGDFQARALKALHGIGARNHEAQRLLGWYAGEMQQEAERVQAREKELTAAWDAELDKAWGSAYEQKFELAQKTLDELFPTKELRAAVLAARLPGGGALGRHPGLYQALAKAGELLAEHQMLGDKQPSQFARTPAEAEAKIRSLMGDKEFQDSLGNRKHSKHVENLELWDKLHSQAYGDGPASTSISV